MFKTISFFMRFYVLSFDVLKDALKNKHKLMKKIFIFLIL